MVYRYTFNYIFFLFLLTLSVSLFSAFFFIGEHNIHNLIS